MVFFCWQIAHVLPTLPLVGQYQQRDPDSVLFIRLFEQSLLQDKIVTRDNYGCYPNEIEHGFAPFYLYFLVNSTAIFYSIFPHCTWDPVAVAGVWPLLINFLSVVLILLSLCLLSKNRALLLLVAFFMLPGIGVAMTGRYLMLDYDYLISFYIWCWILANLWFVASASPLAKIMGGLTVSLFVGTWLGAPLFFFLAVLYAFYLWLTEDPVAARVVEFSHSSMLIGRLVNMRFVWKWYAGNSFSITGYSYFQPLCICAGGFFCCFLGYIRTKFPHNFRMVGLLTILAGSAVLAYMFYQPIMHSTGLLFKADPVHATITELVGAVKADQLALNYRALSPLTEYFGILIVFLPLFVILPPLIKRESGGGVLRDWISIMLFMAVYQIRYVRWPGAGIGLYAGLVVWQLWVMVRSGLHGQRWANLKLGLAFLPIMVLTSMQNFSIAAVETGLSEPQVETLNWIAKNTPETSGYSDQKKPEYSVLSFWDEGNHIAYYARRPVTVNNAMWGYKAMADIFSSRNEKEAVGLCREYGVRYIMMNTHRIIDSESCGFWPYFRTLPKEPRYQMIYEKIEYEKNIGDWFYFWLLNNLAISSNAVSGQVSIFALFLPPRRSGVLPPYMVFEMVEGAQLVLEAGPDSELALSLEIKAGNVPLLYKRRIKAGSDGRIHAFLPYATSHWGGRIRTSDYYKLALTRGDSKTHFKLVVSEEQLQGGKTVDPATDLQEVR